MWHRTSRGREGGLMEDCEDCAEFQKVLNQFEKDLEDKEQELLNLREMIADLIDARLR